MAAILPLIVFVIVSLLLSICNPTGAKAASPKCGTRYGEEKIVNGRPSPLGKWPWLVHLFIEKHALPGRFGICSGSLIAPGFVLTAAHCVEGVDTAVVVTLGSPDIRGRQSVRVRGKRIHTYPGYVSYRGSARDDLALIELAQNVSFSPSVQPICLARLFNEHDEEAVIAGWGKTSKNELTYVLQEGKAEVMPFAACYPYYPGILIHSKHLCAVGHVSDVDLGDSGSPLVVKQADSEGRERFYQVGITSFGALTHNAEVPSAWSYNCLPSRCHHHLWSISTIIAGLRAADQLHLSSV